VDVGPNSAFGVPPPHIPALAEFEYVGTPSSAAPESPKFPNNITLKPLDKYVSKLRAYGESITVLPKKVTQDLIYALGLGFVNCIPPEPCAFKFMAQIQNITFDLPKHTSILQAYASGENGVYTADFPDRPPTVDVDLAFPDPHYFNGTRGTRVKELDFGDTVRIVFQNVFALGILDHPIHLHGHDFYVIGRGYGDYDPAKDPASFNLVNPPAYNTFPVPNGGWLAFQFHANNPGVWFLHCHFDRHQSWGMDMVFITKNGHSTSQSLLGPTHPLPKCP
jgi:laccase